MIWSFIFKFYLKVFFFWVVGRRYSLNLNNFHLRLPTTWSKNSLSLVFTKQWFNIFLFATHTHTVPRNHKTRTCRYQPILPLTFRNEEGKETWWGDLLQVPGLVGSTPGTGPLLLGQGPSAMYSRKLATWGAIRATRSALIPQNCTHPPMNSIRTKYTQHHGRNT